jgi:hypothetical protein
MKKYISLLLFSVVILASCSKQAAYEKDITKPEIEVVYPLDKPVIAPGDPLCMKVLISDDKSLASVWLIVNDGKGFRKEYALPGRSMEIIEKYYAPAGVYGNLTATFYAADEAGNTSSRELLFVVNN